MPKDYPYRDYIVESWDLPEHQTLKYTRSGGYEWVQIAGFYSAVRFESREAARTLLTANDKFGRKQIMIAYSPI